MTRYIDADALMDTIIHRAYSVTDYWNTRDAGMFLCGIEQAVNEQPTVDAVPVIRCKDCKHYNNLLYTHCPQSGMNVIDDEEDYCSWAERKEE